MSPFLVKGDTENPTDDYEGIVELLRKLAEQERGERDCEWLDAAVRRAKEIPRMEGAPHRGNGCRLDRN